MKFFKKSLKQELKEQKAPICELCGNYLVFFKDGLMCLSCKEVKGQLE